MPFAPVYLGEPHYSLKDINPFFGMCMESGVWLWLGDGSWDSPASSDLDLLGGQIGYGVQRCPGQP